MNPRNTVIKLLRRFVKVVRVPELGPCWEYQGALNKTGYATAGWAGKVVQLHRLFYQLKHGPLAPGMLACHKCDNPRCANPSHIFAGTYADNTQDALQKGRLTSSNRQKTHCKHGHAFTPENTYIGTKGGRNCRTCTNARLLAHYHRTK